MNSWRVRYLLFLAILVFGVTIWETRATSTLANGKFALPLEWAIPCLASCIGPFIAFGLVVSCIFRSFPWTLWILILCATAYALLVLAGLLGEHSMAQAAIEAESRGGKYMNCAGSPRFFLIMLAVPLTFSVLMVAGIALFRKQ